MIGKGGAPPHPVGDVVGIVGALREARQNLAADALDGGGIEARHGERGADQIERRLALHRPGAKRAPDGIEAGTQAEIDGVTGSAPLKRPEYNIARANLPTPPTHPGDAPPATR